MKLFCFCYAGGHAAAYWPLKRLLSASGIDVCLIELPGRGMRAREPLLTSMDDVLDDYQRQISRQADGPFAFFGHSMGALVAHLMTLRLVDRGLQTPTHVILSSKPRVPPRDDPNPTYLLTDAAFRGYLESMGSPRTMLDDPDLLQYFMRILRADFRAIETCDQRADETHDIPLTGIVADDDIISPEEARDWQTYSSHEMSLYRFAGHHFYIMNHWADVARIVALKLLEAQPASYARGYK